MGWNTLGQDHILGRLTPALKRRREAQAYLLTGPPHVGKLTLAKDLAQAVNCEAGPGEPCGDCNQCQRIRHGAHTDVRIVDVALSRQVEGRETVNAITIDTIRELEHSLNLNPFESSRSVVIIDNAPAMTTEAANALLKTLEEPPPGVLLILTAQDETDLLPTIRSRCQTLTLLPMHHDRMVEHLTQERSATPGQADALYRLSKGCLGWALTALADPTVLEQRRADIARIVEVTSAGLAEKFAYAGEVATIFGSDRSTAQALLILWLRWWRDLLILKTGSPDWLQNTDEEQALRQQAQDLQTSDIAGFIRRITDTMSAMEANANPRLALETLMVNMPGWTQHTKKPSS